MNRGGIKSVSGCIALAILLAGSFLVKAQILTASEYSGRATGINAVITAGGTPTTYITGDTCPLPARGGTSVVTTSGPLIFNVLGSGTITSTTSGKGLTSSSSSSVSGFIFAGGGWNIRAQNIMTMTQCNCCDVGAPGCAGETSITGFTVVDPSNTNFPVTINGQPNQVVNLPNGAGTITFNERITGPGSLTVIGAHINLTSGGTNYNIIVAASHSDINCAQGVITPAQVNVSGRVLTAGGVGISRATLTLRNSQGAVQTVFSRSSGDYVFSGVTTGQSYVLQATHPSYTFQPRVINVLDELTGVDLHADGP